MFLFKLTLPVLGTATLGAVGTGIYYGVESWKEKGGEKTQVQTKGKNGTEGETWKAGPKQTESLPASKTEKEPNSKNSQQEAPSEIPQTEESQEASPSFSSVELVEETLTPDK